MNELASHGFYIDYKVLYECKRELSTYENVTIINSYIERIVEDRIINVIETSNATSEQIVIENIKQFINENYQHDISLENVAKRVYLSPVYLSKFFKLHMGKNFSEYLIDTRIKNACYLLKNTTEKISVVGEKVGYKNDKYFTRIFKKTMGVTPAEFRKNILKDNLK